MGDWVVGRLFEEWGDLQERTVEDVVNLFSRDWIAEPDKFQVDAGAEDGKRDLCYEVRQHIALIGQIEGSRVWRSRN